jgi:serine/threonine protein kinase
MYHDWSSDEDDVVILEDFIKKTSISDEGVTLENRGCIKKGTRTIVTKFYHPKLEKDVAVKTAIKDLEKESKIHQTLNHPNIVEYMGYYSKWHRYERIDVLFTGICEPKTLDELKPVRDELEYKIYLSQISKALVYLKKMRIVH